MGKYGQAAIMAADLLVKGKVKNPREAWDLSVALVFPNSQSSREKGCPRDTFLGLCGTGLIAGVPPGDYTRSVKNKNYAIKAVAQLKTNRDLVDKEELLWRSVVGEDKKSNSQMDVVATLWRNNLITTNKP